MADRPSSGEDPENQQGYDWIYGNQGPGDDQTRPVPRAPEEATRMMPAQPPPPPGRQPYQPPRPDQIAPTPTDPKPPKTKRKRRGPRVMTIIGLLILAWIAYLVILPIVTWQRVEKVAWEPDGDRPGDQDGTTYLMVGSDSRAGLSKEERRELHTGDAAGQRTDTIMVMHTGAGPDLLMSIPRDSIVEVPGHGETKINAAYAYGGPALLTQTVEQATGIRIDDYVEIGMGGVAGVVDAVGGIEICPEDAMKDKRAGLDIEAGCQDVDGVTALAYARSRHASNFGDLDRAKHQREVVAAVGDEVLSPWTFLNPIRYWNLNDSIPELFTFGEGMSVFNAGRWALAMSSPDLTCGVPIADMAVHWDPERSEEMFGYIRENNTEDIPESLCTPTGLPKNVTG